MKKIKFTCPHCQAKLRVPTHLAGISAPCPKCGRKITAPTDLDSVVDDEAPRKKTSANADAAPKTVVEKAAPVAKREAPAPTLPEAPPAATLPPVPPSVSAVAPAVIEAPPVEERVPAAAPTTVVPPVVDPEPEPIIEETILTPPPEPVAPPTVSDLPQPPVEKTEPIQIRPLPGTLPGVEAAPVETGGVLPRLDAERGLSESTGLDSLVSSPGTPTKLQLPELGDLTGEQSPGDFIVPVAEAPAAPEVATPPAAVILPETSAAPPEPVIPDLADLDLSAPGIPMDELGDPPAIPEESSPEVPGVAEEAREESHEELYEEQGLDHEQELDQEEVIAETVEEPAPLDLNFPLPTEDPSEESLLSPEAEEEVLPIEEILPVEEILPEDAPVLSAPEEPVATVPITELGGDETDSGGLSRGSMEKLLFDQEETSDTVPIQPPASPQSVEPVDDIEAMFEAPPKPLEPSGAEEAQSLEEMFGEIPGEGGNKKLTKVVMLSMIGAVAIITVVVVILGINAAGGLKPQITSNQTDITPPPRISEIPPSSVVPATSNTPETVIDEAPARIDPVAQERVSPNSEGISRSMGSPSSETSVPALASETSAPATIDLPAVEDTVREAPALSFDERVQQIVNGSRDAGGEMNVIGSQPAAAPSPLDSLDETIAGFEQEVNEALGEASPLAEEGVNSPAASRSSNYNPPASFAAPGPDDSPLGQTRDLLDAFLRAPDWQSRIPYTYQGESLRPAIEDYYRKWPFTSFERYSLTLFQVEQDTSLGGPYWVYLVSLNDLDQGYPVIVRVEDGNLKLDWEIYSEFQDQHFAEFQKGAIASPHTFRLILERVSDYFGSDRDSFSNLDDYLVYQINPPYGDLSEYSEYAFVKKGTQLSAELDEVVGLNDEPLAVIITIEEKAFPHGEKHIEITDYLTEGWFR